jgi:uncharacterized repeat protein (TIGR03803 family)
MRKPILFSKSALLLIALCLAIVAVAPGQSRAANLTTLVSFDGTNGEDPIAGLIADANGNLFGTTEGGGAYGLGTVFEIAKTATGYANTPTTLVSFNGTNGAHPYMASLIADANGNLFGTTTRGGNLTDCPSILPPGCGTVFEITKTTGGYASTPTVLYSFCAQANCADGRHPIAGLIADANGNLFGTTTGGGVSNNCGNCGTVFEIAKTAGGYASTPTTLVNFNGTDGTNAFASLIIDADGNLFSTTQTGGAYGFGTVFETKTARGYASTPTTLVSFNGTDGQYPYASLIADANGNLFGTTGGINAVGSNVYGTVFEITKTARGYASTPTTLVSFNGTNGETPVAGLIADADGNLFGTTGGGGAHGLGTVFEITGSGFVPPAQFAGTPGKPNCYGQSVSALAREYGGLNAAAAALGYPSVRALQEAIMGYCEG